jgi:DNA-directed RNA polymerase specialized sigma24 family protein
MGPAGHFIGMGQPAASVIRKLRSALGSTADETADTVLLSRFAATRDENAFELLVWRHSGIVLRVCQSILRDHHGAEDASQAVFLALAKQAAVVSRRGSVAGWLYRVAWRIANKANRRRSVPTISELNRVAALEPAVTVDPALAALVHEEVAKLPEKYWVRCCFAFSKGSRTRTQPGVSAGLWERWPGELLGPRSACIGGSSAAGQ